MVCKGRYQRNVINDTPVDLKIGMRLSTFESSLHESNKKLNAFVDTISGWLEDSVVDTNGAYTLYKYVYWPYQPDANGAVDLNVALEEDTKASVRLPSVRQWFPKRDAIKTSKTCPALASDIIKVDRPDLSASSTIGPDEGGGAESSDDNNKDLVRCETTY
jgi:hypothetical protein